MRNRNGLLQLISERKWDEIVKKFTIDEICQFLSFKGVQLNQRDSNHLAAD